MADSPLPARPAPPTPVSVGDIEVVLFDPAPDNPEQTLQGATYRVQLKLSDNSIEIKGNNLIPHLTGAEVTGLQNLLARLRTKANTAWIG